MIYLDPSAIQAAKMFIALHSVDVGCPPESRLEQALHERGLICGPTRLTPEGTAEMERLRERVLASNQDIDA